MSDLQDLAAGLILSILTDTTVTPAQAGKAVAQAADREGIDRAELGRAVLPKVYDTREEREKSLYALEYTPRTR